MKIFMKRLLTISIISILFLLGCKSENNQSIDLIIKDALHQAVSKEYLPELASVLNKDTIYIITFSRLISPPEEIITYNKDLEYYLPSYVGKWRLIPIDSTYLKNVQELDYLSVSLAEREEDYRVDIISESKVPPDIINIDRGRLVIIYDRYSGYPKIKNLWHFWG
jgi:hypothetical protein